jgi:hypothetical protein
MDSPPSDHLDSAGDAFFSRSKEENTTRVFTRIIENLRVHGVVLYCIPQFCRENVVERLKMASRNSRTYAIVVSAYTLHGETEDEPGEVFHKFRMVKKKRKSKSKGQRQRVEFDV